MVKRLIFTLLIASGLCSGLHAQARVSGSLTAQASSCPVSTSTAGLVVPIRTDYGGLGISIATSPAFSATVTFYASADGGNNYFTWGVIPLAGGSAVTTATGPGAWQQNTSGVTNVCVLVTTYSSGTVAVTAQAASVGYANVGSGGGGGAVSSVFTRTGAVTAQSGDYTCTQVTNCTASGALSTNTIPKATGAATLGNSSVSDNGTTVSTTEPVSVGASVSTTSDGVHPSALQLAGNTTLPSLTANTVTLLGPPSATPTAWSLQVPTAIPTTTDLFSCVVASTNCVLTDSGLASGNIITDASNGTTNQIPKFTAAKVIGNSLCDEGVTTANAMTCTDTAGMRSPAFTSTGTTAGFFDLPQGTTSSAVAPCNTANSYCEQAPTAVTSQLVNVPGAPSTGVMMEVNSSGTLTRSRSGSFGAVSATAQTGSISTATVCAATANTACGQAGTYRISYDIYGSGTACSSVTAGKVVLTFTWTDAGGNAHTTVPAYLYDYKSAAQNVTGTFNFNTALTTEGANGFMTMSTNGTVIQYATTYTACTTGTGTYNIKITTEQLQ